MRIISQIVMRNLAMIKTKYIQHIENCNNANLLDFIPWKISNDIVGYVNKNIASKLLSFRSIFHEENNAIHLSSRLKNSQQRTEAVADILETLWAEEICGMKLNENYAVRARIGSPNLMTIDRGASTHLGIITTGFHLNGFLTNKGQLKMWVAKRSATRGTFPGQLDNVVAGGQPSNLTVAENVIKECNEEASIPKDLAQKAYPTGFISYLMEAEGNLRRHVMYVYDLIMPFNFTPRPNDGEVEAFSLMKIEEIIKIVVSSPDTFKFNCNLVIIDFLIRHGLIQNEDPDYFKIVNGLRSPLN